MLRERFIVIDSNNDSFFRGYVVIMIDYRVIINDNLDNKLLL